MPCDEFDRFFGGIRSLSNRKLGFRHGCAHITPGYTSDGIDCATSRTVLLSTPGKSPTAIFVAARTNCSESLRKILNHLQVVG